MRGPVITGTHSGVAKTAAGAGLAASILFFVVTNFGVWALDSLYPRTLEGLVICYVAAIPFFANTLAGTLFYTAVLFGGFALADLRISPRTVELLRLTGFVGLGD